MGLGRYDTGYYATQVAGARLSARVVMPLLLDATGATSVVDVGCGMGVWLATATELGVENVLGFDGDYIDREAMVIPRDRFRAVDLSQPLDFAEPFDLCISLEVAEHLRPERAESFVRDLTRLAPWVAFSAAIPSQFGEGHLNEQWPDYWHALFLQHGYRPLDLVRPAVWDNPDVEPWYAQNTFLYGKGQVEAMRLPARVIHPGVYEGSLHELRREIETATWLRRLRAKVQLRGRMGLR